MLYSRLHINQCDPIFIKAKFFQEFPAQHPHRTGTSFKGLKDLTDANQRESIFTLDIARGNLFNGDFRLLKDIRLLHLFLQGSFSSHKFHKRNGRIFETKHPEKPGVRLISVDDQNGISPSLCGVGQQCDNSALSASSLSTNWYFHRLNLHILIAWSSLLMSDLVRHNIETSLP